MQVGIRQKLETCKSLPSLPPVAVHVLRLCQRENFDIADVARAIGADGPLSAKVVSLVNSSLFAMRQEVKTVSQALVLLGVNSVRTMALSFAVAGDLQAHQRAGLDYRAYWRRAVFAAVTAHDLARLGGLRHPEEAFLSALLQDVGQMALIQAASEQYQTLVASAATDHDTLMTLEKEAFGCDHAEVGRWLMTQWRLPEVVRAAVGASHEPGRWQRGAEAATDATVKVVALSGVIADVWVDRDVSAAARRAKTRAKELLGLDDPRLLTLLRRVNKAVTEIGPSFNVPVPAPEELARIVEKCEYAFTHATGDLPDAAPVPTGIEPVETVVRVDPLTGLAGRAYFDLYLTEQFEAAKQMGKPLSVIICDPDDLDMISQTFGPDAGDRAIAALGALMGDRLRYRDLAARYGAEEFALVLSDTHIAGAIIVAERLRKKVEDTQHDIGLGDPVRMTISVGCVTLDEVLSFQTPAEMLKGAEEALQQAKQAGRNRVMSYANFHVAA
jgi:diguanylate cyclase (GGDEF)-like protein